MSLFAEITFTVLCLVSLTGCLSAGHKRNKEWNRDFTYLKMIRSEFSDSATLDFQCTDYKAANTPTNQAAGQPATKMNWVKQVQCFMKDPSNNPQQKADLRNAITEIFVTYANHAFGDFEHDSVTLRSITNTGFEFINLGLTAGTTVFGLATELGAASTAMQGAQHSTDKNFYNSETAYVINNKMEALRLAQLVKIRQRELLPVECPEPTAQNQNQSQNQNQGAQPPCYTFEQAMGDVQELYYTGSIHRALQDINNQTAAQSTDAQKKLTNLNQANQPPQQTPPQAQPPQAQPPQAQPPQAQPPQAQPPQAQPPQAQPPQAQPPQAQPPKAQPPQAPPQAQQAQPQMTQPPRISLH